MPPYQWTSIETGCHDKGIEEGAIKPTKDTRDASPHLENQEVHNPIDLPTEIPHQEGHASNVDKWATTPEIAQETRSKRGSNSSTMTMTRQFKSRLLLCHEITWPQ